MTGKGSAVVVEGMETISYSDDLPPQWEGFLWERYLESFGAMDTYQEQRCYDRRSFVDALRDPGYMKFVVCAGDEPRGMAMATNDMEKAKVAYINREYLYRRYPREVEEGRFFYVTSIFITADRQGMGYVKSLLKAMLSFMQAGGRVAGFDFCESKEFLAGLIQDLSRDDAVDVPVRARRLDAQVYYVLEPEGMGLESDLFTAPMVERESYTGS